MIRIKGDKEDKPDQKNRHLIIMEMIVHLPVIRASLPNSAGGILEQCYTTG